MLLYIVLHVVFENWKGAEGNVSCFKEVFNLYTQVSIGRVNDKCSF